MCNVTNFLKEAVTVILMMKNTVLKSESCSLVWKRSLLVPIHKDGDVEQLGNNRRVALGCNEVKVIVRLFDIWPSWM